MNIPIIAITGTKGKTTTTNLVASVLHALNHNVLSVDTAGHYINGQQRSTLQDSKQTWGLVPSVAPGRYLWEFLAQPKLQKQGVAVLESSLGSSAVAGMGYRSHQVGVFLNVFEDHLGSSKRLKSRADIAKAKEFIFANVEREGWVVFNADDKLVTDRLEVVPEHLNVKLLPVGLSFKHFDLASHLAQGGQAVTAKEGEIVMLSKGQTKTLADLRVMPWTFNASFEPSVWNGVMSAAAIYAFLDGKWTVATRRALEATRLDNYGGRLTLLKAASGTTILADYAHEKVSLVEVAKLAKSLVQPGGQLIGIVRLANDRTDQLIKETGGAIAKHYDQCVVFDKIDGYFRKPRVVRSKRFPEVVGSVSELLSKAITAGGGKAERIIREDKAVERAAELAGPADVVVYIVNDDIKRSIGFAKRYFKADFV